MTNKRLLMEALKSRAFGFGENSLLLSVYFGAMVYVFSCSLGIGSVCANDYLLPKAIFSMITLYLFVSSVSRDTPACLLALVMGTPVALLVGHGGIEAVMTLVSGEALTFTLMGDIVVGMLACTPLVLVSLVFLWYVIDLIMHGADSFLNLLKRATR